MSPTPLLEMRGISKRFPGVVALDSVSFQIGRGLLSRRIADLDVVIHRQRSCALCHAGGTTFVLNDARLAFDGSHAALHVDLKMILRDLLRLGQLGADIRFQLCV